MPRQTNKIKITTPELISQINPENIKLSKQFLREKNTRCSDVTILNYASDLNIFFVWSLLNNDNKFFIDIKKLELSEFFSYAVETLRWNSARFGRMKSTLSSFSNFIAKYYDEEFPKFRNLILKVVESMPRSIIREKTILTEIQIKSVLKHFTETDIDIQLACWFALAISSGSRFSELLRFTVDLIDIDNTAFEDIFLETVKPIKTKGRTKTGKLIKKYIIKDMFLPYYELWLLERNKLVKNNIHNFMFVKNNGEPAQESTARKWVTKIGEFLEIPFYAHSARHFYTSYLVKCGIPSELIIELSGWTDTKMVSVYDDAEAKDKKWDQLKNLKSVLSKTGL
jgi:integrase